MRRQPRVDQHILLDPTVAAAVDAAATRAGQTVSDWIRQAIAERLEREEASK
jgi:hypothetical protein